MAAGAVNAAKLADYEDLMPSEEDLQYEEEILRNPYSLRLWWRYLHDRRDAPMKKRFLIYERALKALPGSYKLWMSYLKEKRDTVRGLPPTHPAQDALLNTCERALVTMHKMPRIWLLYLDALVSLRLVTRTRRTFDRCLQSLPVTQHDRIWPLYLDFIHLPGMPTETCIRIYRRYLQLEPGHVEEFIAYLVKAHRFGEAARRLAMAVNDDAFSSLAGKTKYQLWLELCDLITQHPDHVKGLKVENILRHGIKRFRDEVGRLWISLADYYIRRGMFDKARDVYEEGMEAVMTVRDFSIIFDAYTQFEESVLQAKMEAVGDDGEEEEEKEEEGGGGEGGLFQGEDFLLAPHLNDVDLRLARLERLIERRPELVSSVVLRQNPHAVPEWHKRVHLFDGQLLKQIETYTEAVTTVVPSKASGKPHSLWCAFAKFYERHHDLDNARIIFEKATQQPYQWVDDLAIVFCEWAEMELRHNNFKNALDILHTATREPDVARRRVGKAEFDALPLLDRVHKSPRIWNLLADLEESLGTLDSTRAVYYKMLDLRIASPQTILNFASLLKEKGYWEEAFQVYERGIALFKFPHVTPIWQSYMTQFIDRYKGDKMERARDLFEQLLLQVPPDAARSFYLLYADFEERFGLARRAMNVYERACRSVTKEERLSMVQLYISKAQAAFGVSKVREVYEAAIEAEGEVALRDVDVKALCLQYCAMERQLGEIDRARAILIHASQFADPRVDRGFWEVWNGFEVAHGNEDTFREMLRIKRAVGASFSTVHVPGADAPQTAKTMMGGGGGGVMAALEAEREPEMLGEALPRGTTVRGFVSAGVVNQAPKEDKGGEDGVGKKRPLVPQANPDEIDLDDAIDNDEAVGQEIHIKELPMPAAVLGGLGGGDAKRRKTDAM